jgi:gas vesicle protein
MSKTNVLLGLLAGVSAGAVLGILFAPEKGSLTRKQLAKKGEDYAEGLTGGLTDKFNEFIDTLGEKINYAKDEVENLNVKAGKKI